MKNMKKFLAMMLALVMVLGMTVTASAAEAAPAESEVAGKEGDTGSITLENIDKRAASSIKLYPILKADYDEEAAGGRFKGYVYANDAYKTILDAYQDGGENSYLNALKEGAATPAKTLDATTLKSLGEVENKEVQAATFAEVDNSAKTVKEVEYASYVASNIPVGMYLVEIEGTDAVIYNYAVASIYYKNGTNAANGSLNLMVGNATVAAKATEHPGVTKTADDRKATDGHSVSVGDIITYKVTIDPVPNYSGDNPKLYILDTLSDTLGLQKKEGSDEWDVTVTPYNAAGEAQTALTLANKDYKLSHDTDETGEHKLVVDFVTDNGYTLSAYAGGKVEIVYKAKLLATAAGNENDNSNEVVLNYTRDSKVDGEDSEKETPGTKTHTYTFNVGGEVKGETTTLIHKTGEGTTDSVGLAGAGFTLYTENPDTYAGDLKDIKYTNETDSFNNKGEVESKGKNGTIEIKGLAAGIGENKGIHYYLKETTAPTGYTLNSKVYDIYVEASVKAEDGTLTGWKITIDGKNTSTFTVENHGVTSANPADPVEVHDTTMSTLPSTGGIGTTIFTIAGCAIMILAAALFFVSRRKSSLK